jgi:soluble lytic murein transglycosylase-like protein
MKTFLLTILLMSSLPATVAAERNDPESVYYANAYADHYGLPRALVSAIIDEESGGDPFAISNKGAQGLMQLMPQTEWRYGVHDPFSKSDNIGGGCRYLRDLAVQFHGDLRLVAAAYFTGEKRVQLRGLALDDRAVIAYVESVRRLYLHNLSRSTQSGVSEEQR